MKPGFLLEAARKHAKGMVRGGIGLCVLCLLVLLLNGKFVYNSIAGPFELTPTLAEVPTSREFARVNGSFMPTPVAAQHTTKVRVFRVIPITSTDISARFFVVPMNGKYLVVKAPPDFSGNTANGRLVELPDSLRTSELISQTPVADRTLKSDELCSMMLDASSDYVAGANLFVIVAVFFLVTGSIATVIYAFKSTSPQKYPMLRMVAPSGPVLSTLRRIEQEFLAEGDNAFVGPLMISPAWIYDSGKPLLFPMKDVVAVTMKLRAPGNAPAGAVEFWLRSERQNLSVKATANECVAIIAALASRIPWAVLEQGSAFDPQWRKDRQFCIAEMERRKKQMQAPAPATK